MVQTWADSRRLAGAVAVLLAGAPAFLGVVLSHPAHAASSAGGTTAASQWTGTWEASPERPVSSGFDNVTLRLIARTTIGGSATRIRLSNEFGATPLHIGAATVGLQSGAGATVVPGTMHALTFSGGHSSATIAPGGKLTSDGVSMDVLPGTNLAISLYLPRRTGAPTRHAGHQNQYISTAGDHVADAAPLAYPTTTTTSYFLSGVDVVDPGASSVITLGDSLTDGTGAVANLHLDYPAWLSDRLQAAGGEYAKLSVLNAGIGGNELLRTSACCYASPSMLARFDQDVAGQPGARDVVVLAGTNDIYGAHHAGASAVIAGLRRLISMARDGGLRIFGGTILPSAKFTAHENETRAEVNHWITTGGAFDGVFDFASAVADPADSNELNPAYDSGDNLHPNDLGHHAMADAVNIDDLLGYTYDNTALDYSGPWTHANGSVRYTHGDYEMTEANSDSPRAGVSVAFTGTGVEWVGPRGANSGIAGVYLDGRQVATVDTYDPVTKLFQQNLYEAQFLAPGRHVLTIKPTGSKNLLSTGTGIAIDAINVTG